MTRSKRSLVDEVDEVGPSLIPGQPGYRTRPGRSGYDPWETRLEMGYMTGVLLRKLGQHIQRLLFKHPKSRH